MGHIIVIKGNFENLLLLVELSKNNVLSHAPFSLSNYAIIVQVLGHIDCHFLRSGPAGKMGLLVHVYIYIEFFPRRNNRVQFSPNRRKHHDIELWE